MPNSLSDLISDTEEGIFLVNNPGKWKYYRTNGTNMNNIAYDKAHDFQGGFGRDRNRGKDNVYQYLRKEGLS